MASLDEFAREQVILAVLKATGHVAVNDLSERFGVSTVTVRKDLDMLERRSLLRRVRGGAVGVDAGDEGTFEMRLRHSRAEKSAVARAAATLIEDGDVIAIDASTTAYYLAQEILDRRNLVVVTNGLRIALLLMEHSSARVLVTGGVVRRSSGSVVGPIGDLLSSRGRIAKGFFGVLGLSTTHGLMDMSAEEAHTKRSMSAACDQVFALFDGSKAGGFGLHSFTPVGEVSGLYTDAGAPADVLAAWRGLGVPVTTVRADAAPSPVVELPHRPHRRKA